MITTSVLRMKNSGYWCASADEQAGKLLVKLSKAENDEVDIRDCLHHIGLSSAIHALGTPRPRYKTEAHAVLLELAKFYLEMLEKFSRSIPTSDYPDKITTEFPPNLPRAVWIPSFDATRAALRQSFAKKRFNAEHPISKLYYDACMVLVTDLPLHIRLLHSIKYFLQSVAVYDKIDAESKRVALVDKLNGLLAQR